MTLADDALNFARSQLGKPYVWGATGPDAYDCSGLVLAAFQRAGVPITGRTTYDFVKEGQPVAQADLQPGDLVFPDAGHVQIYEGGGKVIEAPHTGANVQEVPMWGFWAARRLTAPGSAVTAGSSTAPASAGGGLFTGFGKLGFELALGGAGLLLVVLGAKRFTGQKGS